MGTEYTIGYHKRADDKFLSDRDGYCDKTSRTIVVSMADEDNELDDYDVYSKTILRHEIIHAFLFESGLHENFMHPEHGHDETYVDWIAIQFPKILKVYEQLKIL